MKPNLNQNPVRRACAAGCMAWLMAFPLVGSAEEKIQASTPEKSSVKVVVPKASRELDQPARSTIDLFNGGRSVDVGDGGGGFSPSTGRSIDPRTAKILLETLSKRKSDAAAALRPSGSDDELRGRSDVDNVDRDAESLDDARSGSSSRDSLRSGDELGRSESRDRNNNRDRDSDRDRDRDRDGRSANNSKSRDALNRRTEERSTSPFRNQAATKADATKPFGQGEQLQVSDPFDIRPDASLGRETLGSSLLDRPAQALAPDLKDTSRSSQFREFIKAPDSAGAAAVTGSGIQGALGPQVDRNSQFKALLGSTPGGGSSALPKSVTPVATGLPSVADLGTPRASGESLLQSLAPGGAPAGSTLIPNLSSPAAPLPGFGAKSQPAILPLPRRF